MNKIIAVIIPIAALLLFVGVMQGACYYLSSHQTRNAMNEYMGLVENDLQAQQWEKASSDLQGLDSIWEKSIPWLQFHAEMVAIDDIKKNMARLRGAIEAQDQPLSLVEISELEEHWENLKN